MVDDLHRSAVHPRQLRADSGGATSTNLAAYFQNSVVIAVPAKTPAPLILAIMASYAFSVLEWKGRDIVFVVVFALQIVPLDTVLIPLLRVFSGTAIADVFPFLSLGGAHDLRVAAGDLPAAQLHVRSAADLSSRRLG